MLSSRSLLRQNEQSSLADLRWYSRTVAASSKMSDAIATHEPQMQTSPPPNTSCSHLSRLQNEHRRLGCGCDILYLLRLAPSGSSASAQHCVQLRRPIQPCVVSCNALLCGAEFTPSPACEDPR